MERLADNINLSPAGDGYKVVHRLLGHRRKKPFAVEVLPTVLQRDGTVCRDADEIRARWREHFSDLEAGESVSPNELLEAATTNQAWPLPASITSLPNQVHLEQALRCAPLGKAVGGDAIPQGLGRAAPEAMAKQLMPLSLKLTLRGTEPLGYKSGLLHHMYKGRGDRRRCDSHRGILLIPTMSKILHRTLRPRLARHFEDVSLEMQLGGRKGQSTEYATHAVRSFIRAAVASNISCAVMFADITAAYYGAVRELTTEGRGKADVEAICRTLPIAAEDKLALGEHLQLPSAMKDRDAESWLCRITNELNSATWMALAGDSGDPILTKRGTRPGSSFADITFGLLMRRVLDFRHQLRVQGDDPPFPVVAWDGRRHFAVEREDAVYKHSEPSACPAPKQVTVGDIVWADDLAACLSCASATSVATVVGTEVGCLADGFAQHGLTLAYGPSKTAAVCVIRGPSSRQVRKQLFGHCGPEGSCTIPVLREHQLPDELPLVCSYRHLGVIQSADGSIRKELHQKIGAAWSAFREARRKIFRSKRISVDKKAVYLRGLVLSRLTNGSGAWPPLKDGEARAFQGCVINMYRQLLCLPHDSSRHLYGASVCAQVGLSSPGVILHVERLRYALRLVRNGPEQLWALLRQDAGYCSLMQESFEWLFCRVKETCPLPCPLSNWEEWVQLLCQRPGLFKGWVKRAEALQHLATCAIAKHIELYQLLTSIVAPARDEAAVPQLETCTEACVACRRAFPTLLSWASHAARVHGYRTIATRVAAGRTCRGCGRTYATQHRLKRHLDNSDVCIRRWGAFCPAAEETAVSGHMQAPPTAADGSFCEDAFSGLDGSVCKELLDELRLCAATNVPDLMDVLSRHFAPLAVLRRTVQQWLEGLPVGSLSRDCGENLCSLLYPEFLCDAVQVPAKPKPVCLGIAPEFKPLSPFSCAASGNCRFFAVTEPPLCHALLPWSHFGTLRMARCCLLWLSEAVAVCAQAIKAAAVCPVAIAFNKATQAAIPLVWGWFRELGFVYRDGRLWSPGFTSLN